MPFRCNIQARHAGPKDRKANHYIRSFEYINIKGYSRKHWPVRILCTISISIKYPMSNDFAYRTVLPNPHTCCSLSLAPGSPTILRLTHRTEKYFWDTTMVWATQVVMVMVIEGLSQQIESRRTWRSIVDDRHDRCGFDKKNKLVKLRDAKVSHLKLSMRLTHWPTHTNPPTGVTARILSHLQV